MGIADNPLTVGVKASKNKLNVANIDRAKTRAKEHLHKSDTIKKEVTTPQITLMTFPNSVMPISEETFETCSLKITL